MRHYWPSVWLHRPQNEAEVLRQRNLWCCTKFAAWRSRPISCGQRSQRGAQVINRPLCNYEATKREDDSLLEMSGHLSQASSTHHKPLGSRLRKALRLNWALKLSISPLQTRYPRLSQGRIHRVTLQLAAKPWRGCFQEKRGEKRKFRRSWHAT